MTKLSIFTVLFFLFSVSSSWAQIQATIKEETRSMSKGSFNCLILDLPGTNVKDVAKAWQKYIKSYKGKTKFDRKSDEYITDDAEIKNMSDNTVDITAKIVTKGDVGCELVVWYNLGVTYLSSNEYADRYPAGEAVLQGFTKEVSLELIEAELKDEEKKLKELGDELKKMEKEQEDLEKDIENYKQTITEMEQKIKDTETGIEENKTSQETKKTEMSDQTKVIEEVKQRLESVKAGK
ncbi:MAG: hypothetical protein MK212_19305 [Saprospiraceae bacterium]|nr:hypothetical protein [Saprospiraceae bacterium]